jgi:hypothetical protein
MGTTSLSRSDTAEQGEALYERKIRASVETPENIGKMVIMDVETEEYEVDDLGLDAARHLQARHPDALLYGKRIGYDVSEALGGTMERTIP